MRNWFAVIGFVVVALVVGVCVSCSDDDDSEESWVPRTESSRPPDDRDGPARDCDDQSCSDHRDCYQSQDYCSDDDQLQVGPICVEDGACRFG